MRAGFIQMTPSFGQTTDNVDQAVRLIREHSADLLVLPEFFNTGYLFCKPEEVAILSEPVAGGYTTGRLLDVSRETGTVLVAGIPEKDDANFFNTAIMITPDGDIHRYRKTHLFDREKLFFRKGDTGFGVFEWQKVRVGMMICFDWYFTEAARTLALSGAQIIAHPSNLVLPHCPRAMITRCLENRVFAITCNRSGAEARDEFQLTYIGESQIVGPQGNILGKANRESTAVIVVDIDPMQADNKHVTDRNDLFNDRCPEFYRVL